MKKSVSVILCLTLVAGCASVPKPIVDVATSTDTLAVCKTADVLSTYYVLSRGIAHEANPIVASLLTHGWVPFIAVSVGMWYLVKKANSPTTTVMANAVTCGAAVNNILLIP